jgi:hypothetical protein
MQYCTSKNYHQPQASGPSLSTGADILQFVWLVLNTLDIKNRFLLLRRVERRDRQLRHLASPNVVDHSGFCFLLTVLERHDPNPGIWPGTPHRG